MPTLTIYPEPCEQCQSGGWICSWKTNKGPGCFPCSKAKIRCSFAGNWKRAPPKTRRSGGDGDGSDEVPRLLRELIRAVRDCQADNGAWYKRWYRDNGRRKRFDGFLVEAIGELAKDSAKATGAIGKMYYWLEENGYARAVVSDEDRGEGSSKMVKAGQIRGS